MTERAPIDRLAGVKPDGSVELDRMANRTPYSGPPAPPRPATVPTMPEAWQAAKDSARATALGSEPGRWSQEKSAMAQVAYRKAGGDFVEDKQRIEGGTDG